MKNRTVVISPKATDIEAFCDGLKKYLLELSQGGHEIAFKTRTFIQSTPISDHYAAETLDQFLGARYTIEIGQPARETAGEFLMEKIKIEHRLGKIGEIGAVPPPFIVEKKT